MKLIHLEPIDQNRGRAVILSLTTPSKLKITGGDVDGMEDDYIVAEGSIIVTPSNYYVAYSDGTFTKQEG